jgi:hypothetical protein
LKAAFSLGSFVIRGCEGVPEPLIVLLVCACPYSKSEHRVFLIERFDEAFVYSHIQGLLCFRVAKAVADLRLDKLRKQARRK